MIQNTKTPPIKGRKHRKQRACWINDQYRCRCGSSSFTIFRERVARKNHTRHSHRKRYVGICEKGHKTRIAFPTRPRQK